VQPITGKLIMRGLDGRTKPVEFVDVQLQADGAAVAFVTGSGGEFFIEQIPAAGRAVPGAGRSECRIAQHTPPRSSGTFHASFEYQGRQCDFNMLVPASEEMIIDLGSVPTCVMGAEKGVAPPVR